MNLRPLWPAIMVAVLFTRSSAATDSVQVTVNQKTDGQVAPGAYQAAAPGAYLGTVTVTVSP